MCGDRFSALSCWYTLNPEQKGENKLEVKCWVVSSYYPLPSLQVKGATPKEAVLNFLKEIKII